MIDSRRAAALILTASLGFASTADASKVETWRQDSPSEFAKGKKERVVVSDSGRVRLGRKIGAVGTLDATHVWDLARAKNGAIYAATGGEGKVYRRSGDDAWEVVHDSEDSQVLSVAAMPDGRVYAGTGPNGKVVEVSDPKAPTHSPDPAVTYVWDLASDAAGNLYAATGPTGQLWKRDSANKWSVLFDSKHTHLLCLAVGPDGSIFAGSDGEGLIYKIAPDGKASVLYDAAQSEVRALLVAPDGSLFAGTAAEAGGGPSGGGNPLKGLGGPTGMEGGNPTGTDPVLAAQVPGVKPGNPQNTPPGSTSGGTASPRPGPPGENAVYRIEPDGAPREIFRAKALIYALAMSGDRLLVGTGPEGLIYEVRDSGRESSQIARIDHGQALALLGSETGDVLIGAGESGAVLRMEPGHAPNGSILSDVHDTKLLSRFGAVSWKADRPDGTEVAIQVRTGNVGEPDATWSNWSAPMTVPDRSRADVPPGRFVQYRATLTTTTPAASPELRSIAILYQTANLAPEIARVIVPDLGAGDGSARPAKQTVRWDVTDPNDDEMAYTLHIRKDGWPDWVRLTETPLTEKTYNWDITAVPAGVYTLKVTASDRPSNPPDSAIARELTSEPFLVDHLAPTVGVTVAGQGVKIALKDDLTRLVKAAYALDGGEWIAVFPDDGLFDTTAETITIPLKDLTPGTHILTVRATDAAGNVGTGDAVFKAP